MLQIITLLSVGNRLAITITATITPPQLSMLTTHSTNETVKIWLYTIEVWKVLFWNRIGRIKPLSKYSCVDNYLKNNTLLHFSIWEIKTLKLHRT